MKRKITAILMTLTLSFTLWTGCGSSKNRTSNETADDSAAEGSSESGETGDTESGDTESYEPATIRVGVGTGRTPHFTGLVAQEEGIFDQYNLTVQLVEFSAGIDTVNAMELGQVDVAYVADFGGLNRLGNLSEPDDSKLRFIARLEETATVALYVNPDTVSSIEDLKGKSVALQLGTISEYFNVCALAEGGLTLDDIDVVSIDSAQTGLALAEKGEVDGVWTGYANIEKMEEYGYTKLVNHEDLGIYQESLYVSTDEYIATNAEVIGRYLKATAESYDVIAEKFDQAVAEISDVTGMEASVVADTLHGTTLLLDFPEEVVDYLTELDEWMIEHGYYENSIDFDQFIDTSVLKEALPEADVF